MTCWSVLKLCPGFNGLLACERRGDVFPAVTGFGRDKRQPEIRLRSQANGLCIYFGIKICPQIASRHRISVTQSRTV